MTQTSFVTGCTWVSAGLLLSGLVWAQPVFSEPISTASIWLQTERFLAQADPASEPDNALDLGIEQDIIESSPVLQRWLDQPPDLLDEIRTTPALPTRLQAAVSHDYWTVGLADLTLVPRLTLSGDYQQSFDEPDDRQFGSVLRYYVAPAGSLINFAPQVGYRTLDQSNRSLRGLQYGAQVSVALAPRAADITLSYTWLDPVNTDDGWATLADVTAAYALSPSIRIAGRYRWQHTTIRKDRHFGVVLEWIP